MDGGVGKDSWRLELGEPGIKPRLRPPTAQWRGRKDCAFLSLRVLTSNMGPQGCGDSEEPVHSPEQDIPSSPGGRGYHRPFPANDWVPTTCQIPSTLHIPGDSEAGKVNASLQRGTLPPACAKLEWASEPPGELMEEVETTGPRPQSF